MSASADAMIERPKDREDEYRVRAGHVRLLSIPEHRFVMVDGSGRPGPETFDAREPSIYGTAYGLRFALKRRGVLAKVGPLDTTRSHVETLSAKPPCARPEPRQLVDELADDGLLRGSAPHDDRQQIPQRDDTHQAPVELDRRVTHLRLKHLRSHLADARGRSDRDRAHRHVVADLRRLGIMAGRNGAGEIAFGDDADESLLVERSKLSLHQGESARSGSKDLSLPARSASREEILEQNTGIRTAGSDRII